LFLYSTTHFYTFAFCPLIALKSTNKFSNPHKKMTDPVNGAAAEEELVDYEEEEVVEGDAAKGDQVRITAKNTPMVQEASTSFLATQAIS
jgi:hypothetical protein